MQSKLLFIDCDSTLSSIEGIDELARLRGKGVFETCVQMTDRAMNGEIALEDVYGERLKLIAPTEKETLAVGQLYIDTVERGALSFVSNVKASGWEPIIISGGITQAIEPFARFLGIEKVEAVRLNFDAEGRYSSYDEEAPTSRMGGKIEIIQRYKEDANGGRIVMIGDGSSDLETKDYVDLFIGFGGFVAREKVEREADVFTHSLSDIPLLLNRLEVSM